ncbi:MAG: hypothetical protein M1812_000467 [Candelaria pacifica]|nr:MAG: hypothetical protein M1812_000467 [Candelaria pacifica]
MGLGILGDSKLDHVPGTCLVLDDASRSPETAHTNARLKYDRTGRVPIILVPQPSDDPNDPLNWPIWKRDAILLILSILGVLASSLASILAANTLTLSLYLGTNFTRVALLTGYHLCGVGVAGFIFIASARVWGKRHLYLLGSVLLVVGSAWAGASGKSYKSLVWARVIQGVGVAPFEALVNASVGDMYFVHQRGKRMALSNLALFGGAFITPVIVGKITHTIGWPWTFYFVAIFVGATLPLVIFFVPETAYRRSQHLNTDLISTDNSHRQYQPESGLELPQSHNGNEAYTSHNTSGNGSFEKQRADAESRRLTYQDPTHVPPKDGFTKTLMPFNGRKTNDSFWKLILRPFPLFLQPAILWGCLVQGTMIGWTVLIGVVLAIIFLGPPLFFDEVKTGYLYTGPFIGAILGFIMSGLLADWSARFMTERNKGVFEPEFRILLVIPQFIFSCAGLYGFGITVANVSRYGWFVPDFFFALVVMGMVIGTVASALYIVDAHRDIAVEAFTCLLIFKNMFSFGLTWSAYNWILANGVVNTFYIIASVQVVVCLLSIPMYIFGKRNRSFFHRHDLLRITHLL